MLRRIHQFVEHAHTYLALDTEYQKYRFIENVAVEETLRWADLYISRLTARDAMAAYNRLIAGFQTRLKKCGGADAVQKESPELAAKVSAGKMTVNAAKNLLPKAEPTPVKAKQKAGA